MAAQALIDLPVGSAYIACREARGLLRVPFVDAAPLSRAALAAMVATATAASRFAQPIADARAAIAARRRDLLQSVNAHAHPAEKAEPESWRETFDYPDPPAPPDAPRGKPQLRLVRPETEEATP